MHSEVCPICLGKGLIPENYPVPLFGNPTEKVKICHGCGGKGWVEVKDDYYYYIPYTWPWPYVSPEDWEETTGNAHFEGDNMTVTFEFNKKSR